MLFAKNQIFCHLSFWENQEREDRFLIFWIKKESSQHQKSLKRRNFAKGLVHAFSQTK